MAAMTTPPKHAKAKLDAALRANLRRRKAQMQARDDMPEADSAEGAGVRYSGFAVRDKSQAEAD
jgi:hypothetical protein